jgi:exonuclease III
MYINIATFNCKNILNSSNCIKTLQKLAHVIYLQEHWLFNFEQNLAEKITSNLKFKIKSVDDKNPIPSTQKPRGYGGTAIAWKKEIDHLIDDYIEERNERIVCIRIKVKPNPILIVSVYMPYRGNRSGDEEYKECLDILFEITRKYHIDHRIILSGDWNCDLTGTVSPRQKKLEAFLQECGYLHKASKLS